MRVRSWELCGFVPWCEDGLHLVAELRGVAEDDDEAAIGQGDSMVTVAGEAAGSGSSCSLAPVSGVFILRQDIHGTGGDHGEGDE